METTKLGVMEQRFADLIWANEPVNSRVLTELCGQAFNWKRTTAYTMLRRLSERGLFENQNGTVVALIKKEDFLAAQGERFLSETFNGSLPQFIAAFTRRNKLSDKEIDELQTLINRYKEG